MLVRSWLSTTVALSVLLVCGCSTSRTADDPGGGGGPDMQAEIVVPLVLSPRDTVVQTDGKTPVVVPFQATQAGQDVTAQAVFFAADGGLGSFQGSTFTSTPGVGGKTKIHAQLNGAYGETTLTVRLSAVVLAPGAPPDAPGKFGGPADPDPKNGPQLAYPPAGALIPPNLNVLEVQWQQRGGALFEVRFVGDGLDLKIYTPCVAAGSGCALTPDEATWRMLSSASRGRAVQLAVREVLPSGAVVTSAAQPLSFANEDMQGGLYYWAASSGGIHRYDFGRRGQRAEVFYDPILAAKNGAITTCVGCHALSRSGKRVALGMNIPKPAALRALEVATRKTIFDLNGGMTGSNGSNFQAFTPDGSRLITTEGNGLTVRDAADGTLIGQRPMVENANMPDFSPDGKLVVFAREPANIIGALCKVGLCPNLQVSGASLYSVPFAGDAFGTPKLLVQAAAGENNYYPAFSPDGQFVAFNRATSKDSYDAMDARVLIVSRDGGTPIELGAVNSAPGNSWPKWSPFRHHFQGAPILWLTFSSRRSYGLRPTTTSQIWMVPVDANQLGKGKDPGYPPVRLPFQDLGTGNHIAQWVESVERAPCDDLDKTGCLPGEMCVDGHCVPVLGATGAAGGR